MSSLVALETKNVPGKAIASSHRSLSHGHRVGVLAKHIALHIESLVPQGRARCLDIGCGDMQLAEAVRARAPRTDWRYIDMHRPPVGFREDGRWSKYRQFDGRRIPHADREFDVALLCDVLQHHAPEDAAELLAEAGRVAEHVLVKDHFEFGAYSRTMLRLMDFVGSMGDGLGVPERYFTREGFVRLAKEQRFVITALDSGLDLYEHLPGLGTLLRRDWQFIAVLHH